jgi:hypothetical protein
MHRRKSLKLAAAAADHQRNESSSSANQAGVTSVSEKGEEETHQETPVKLSDIKTPVVTPVPSSDDSDSTKRLSHHSLSSSHHHQTDTHVSSTSSHPTTPVSPSASSSTAVPAHSLKKTEIIIEPIKLDLSNDEKKKDSHREHSPPSISALPSPAPASSPSSVIINAPPKMIGWLRKRGHVVPNWKTRYFVLDNGFLTYYVDKLDLPPYGKTMKGQLCLAGYREATVIDQNTGKINQEKMKG